MLKLMKYEMRKTLFMKLALIAVTAITEIFFLIGYSRNVPKQQAITLLILALIALFGILFMGIQSIIALHRDMNTRQSYMLFMTPNSTYGILGAKVLENTLSTLIAGALYVGLIFLDVRLLLAKNGEIADSVRLLKSLLGSVGMNLDNFTFAGVASFVSYMLCSWVATVTSAYFADVIASSLLNGKKVGGFLSVLLFFGLSWAISELVAALPAADGISGYWVQSAYNLVIAAVCYVGTALLMDKYLSV